MYKKILIPTDGSEKSKDTISRLINVMNETEGEVIILAVAKTIKPHHLQSKRKIAELNETIIDEAKEDAKDLKNLMPDYIKVSTSVVSGRPSDKIIEFADKENIDLIIIPTSGKSSLDKFRLGSVAEKVVSGSQADVLVIH